LAYCQQQLTQQVGLAYALGQQSGQSQPPQLMPAAGFIPGVTPPPPAPAPAPILPSQGFNANGNSQLASGADQGCSQNLITSMVLLKASQTTTGQSAWGPQLQQYVQVLISNFVKTAGANMSPTDQLLLATAAYQMFQTQFLPNAGAMGPMIASYVPNPSTFVGGSVGVPSGTFYSPTWTGTATGTAGSVQPAVGVPVGSSGSLGIGLTSNNATGYTYVQNSGNAAGGSGGGLGSGTGSAGSLGLGLKSNAGTKAQPLHLQSAADGSKGSEGFKGLTLVH
jgi:hypothetical protein